MEEVYQVRYLSYKNAGLIAERDDAVMKDEFDETPFATTILAIAGNRLAGTIRVIEDTKTLGLPVDQEGFAPYLWPLRQRRRKIVEVGRYCFLPEYQNKSKKILAKICLQALNTSIEKGANDIVVEVASHHASFYKRIFKAKPLFSFHSVRYGRKSVGLRMNLDDYTGQLRFPNP